MCLWKVGTHDVKSRCGFFGSDLQNWNQRVEHIGRHFEAGARLVDWTGGLGFDSSVITMTCN
jgi:hypothetical protein